jgi:hypothetical protein
MTFLLSNGRKLFLPKQLRKKTEIRNAKFEPLRVRTDAIRIPLTQMPEQQVQHGGQVRSAESRHMLDHINRPSQKMSDGESNQHAAEDPEHQ